MDCKAFRACLPCCSVGSSMGYSVDLCSTTVLHSLQCGSLLHHGPPRATVWISAPPRSSMVCFLQAVSCCESCVVQPRPLSTETPPTLPHCQHSGTDTLTVHLVQEKTNLFLLLQRSDFIYTQYL